MEIKNNYSITNKVNYIDIKELVLMDKNPRRISKENFERLKKSLQNNKEFFEARPIICSNRTGKNIIIAGNQRYKAAKELGMKKVPCVIMTLTEEKEKEINIRDNVELGEWDFDILANEFNEEDLKDWGVELEHITVDNNTEDIEIKEEDLNNLKIDSIVKKGQVYQLGNSFLMCGDATNIEDIKKLMNNKTADLCFTSPPYNINISPTEKTKSKYNYVNNNDNQTTEDYTNFLSTYLFNSLQFCQYSFLNIQSLSNNKISLIDLMYKMKDYYNDTIIWNKGGQPAIKTNVLNSCFEYIHIFSKYTNKRNIDIKEFRGTIDNVININKVVKNDFSNIHNATFPSELVEFIINNFCNNSILDLFGGTGTTLLVAEKLNKQCFIMEIEEKYCDVIIYRYENMFNQKAKLLKE